MPRKPKPWYWEERAAWYCQLNGKRVRLGEQKKEAEREFYKLMATEGRLEQRQLSRLTFGGACEMLIQQTVHHRPSTRRLYVDMLGPVGAKFKSRRLETIKPQEMIAFVADYQGTGYNGRTFGEGSRFMMFRYIKTLFRWARDMGLLEINPLARTPNPWSVPVRERPMLESEYLMVQSDRRLNDRFKEVLEFIWRTGIRPSELCALSARHLDVRMPIARFQPTEHKTGRRTGRQREVYFPADLWARVQAYAQERREGPLLRNRNGSPWTQDLISDTFHRVKTRLGLTCVIYQARHAFLTRLVESGVPVARAARIAGHGDTRTIMTHYYRPEQLDMAKDVESVDVGAEDCLAEIRKKVAIERKKKRSVYSREEREVNDGDR